MIIRIVTDDFTIIPPIAMKITTTGAKTSIANIINLLHLNGAIGASIGGLTENITIFTTTGPTTIVKTVGGTVGGIRGTVVGGMATSAGMVIGTIETDAGTIRTDNTGAILTSRSSGGGEFLPLRYLLKESLLKKE
jgi:hypothetical protein